MSKKIKMIRKNGGMEKGKEYAFGGKSKLTQRAAEILVGNGFAEYLKDCKGDCDEDADCPECEKQAKAKKAPAKKKEPMSKIESTKEEKK